LQKHDCYRLTKLTARWRTCLYVTSDAILLPHSVLGIGFCQSNSAARPICVTEVTMKIIS
jgi:hypothetical protein